MTLYDMIADSSEIIALMNPTEGRHRLINALYAGGHCTAHSTNRMKGDYLFLVYIPHSVPEYRRSYLLPLHGVPNEINLTGTIPIKEALTLYEKYHA